MAPHSSTLVWKIPWMEEPGGLQSMGSLKSQTRLSNFNLHFHFSLSCIGEGNGNWLQCSCLENPRDGGAWWAAVYGVAQCWTWLKRLSSSSSSIYTMAWQHLKICHWFQMRNYERKHHSLICSYQLRIRCLLSAPNYARFWGIHQWKKGIVLDLIELGVQWWKQASERK